MTVRSASIPASVGGAPQLLFTLAGVNMAVADVDNTFTKLFGGTTYVITSVIAQRASGGTSVACAGGIYTAAAKGGTPLIATVQSWVALTGAGKIVVATNAAVLATDSQTATPILNLTTGSTAAATANLFIYGVVLG